MKISTEIPRYWQSVKMLTRPTGLEGSSPASLQTEDTESLSLSLLESSRMSDSKLASMMAAAMTLWPAC